MKIHEDRRLTFGEAVFVIMMVVFAVGTNCGGIYAVAQFLMSLSPVQ